MPIGGTSAGLAVLGQFDFAALKGYGVTSAMALQNPYTPHITFDSDFLAAAGRNSRRLAAATLW